MVLAQEYWSIPLLPLLPIPAEGELQPELKDPSALESRNLEEVCQVKLLGYTACRHMTADSSASWDDLPA